MIIYIKQIGLVNNATKTCYPPQKYRNISKHEKIKVRAIVKISIAIDEDSYIYGYRRKSVTMLADLS